MNLKQQEFINLYAQTGDKIASYKQAYRSQSDNLHAIDSAANRLLRKPEIKNALLQKKQDIYADAEAVIEQKLKHELMKLNEKRLLLADIARGEAGEMDVCHRLRAIDIDNRMEGMYGRSLPAVEVFLHRIYQQVYGKLANTEISGELQQNATNR